MAGAQKKILLIEDDPFMVQLLSGELTRAGFQVELATDGEMAVSKFQEVKPDGLVVDIILPKKTGLEALREIRALPGGDAPAIVLSNLEDPQHVAEAQELEAKAYLVKANVDLSEISAKLKQAMGMS